jgi:hypothetical protein
MREKDSECNYYEEMIKKLEADNAASLRDLRDRHRSEVDDEEAEIERQEKEIELMLRRFDEINR